MKFQPFWILFISILLIWAGNYLYAEQHKLAHPVFLDHYMDVNTENELFIPFYFITNKADPSFIQVVELGNMRGAPDRSIGNNGVEEVEQFGRYSLRRVNIQFDPLPISSSDEKVVSDKMTVYFSEHQMTDYPIGRMVFQNENEASDPLAFKSGSAGEYTETRLDVTESLSIESIETSFDDVLEDRFHIKVQSASSTESAQPEPVIESDEWNKAKGTDVRNMKFPLWLEGNDWLTVKSFVDPSLHAVLDITVRLNGRTEAGKAFTTRVGHLEEPYVTTEVLQQIIEKRTEEGRHE